ncbi:aromatic ring-hydroxylating oxygenase subunit alpha [Comamonas resistens]|uniref:Aromatic ring-hydroxylating dioxygenase subunit alpha n=1 Tax=Comamonas resistens TaxID=3046670 RepID=A0ABY8SY59_9BURK|nr:aromatic ring-hydroxylating dioxygenase subunit alpha [Comamonas resistens]MDL5037865.1 aromatic ring-hydroxylating dioxygenase subunit alpha [Comamonas resistens]WHS67680.1 aromatic ring-hydroxylating dioxygenase subunit alpha [Comamonas resistens]
MNAAALIFPRPADLYERALQATTQMRADAQGQGGQLPVAGYRSPEQFAQEMQLLRQHPQAVAASSDLARPGSWLSLTRLGTPLLLVRQPDGKVQAFLNVCRHRGARVVAEGAGDQARAFSCPYHAWTYQTDGALRGVPQAQGFAGLCQQDMGLRRLACHEVAGLIWVVLDPQQQAQDIAAALGPAMQDLATLAGMQSAVGYAPRSYEVAANWKLLVDGVFEAYHFKIAHQKTIAAMFAGNVQLVDECGLHRRLYLIKANFAREQPPPEAFEPRLYGNLTYFFFPTNTVLVQPDHAQFSCLEPISPERTRIHEITLLPQAPATEKAGKYWQANVDLYRRTLAEDYALAESIQQGLASGANEHFTFASFEYSIPRFHAQLQQALENSNIK